MSQVVAAMKRGEAWAVCFFLKCRGGWKETQALQHSGEDGKPIPLEIVVTRAGS